MAVKGEESTQSGTSKFDVPTDRLGAGAKRDVPQARKRVKYDKTCHELVKVGAYYRKDLYKQYRRIAFFRRQNLYDLINDAMASYLPELKKPQGQKLKEAGQAELLAN